MFHAPTTESKQQNNSTRSQSPPERTRELSPRVSVTMGPASAGASAGAAAPGTGSGVGQPLAHLHSAYGNQAVLRMLSRAPASLQTKLTVNQPGDQYEQEADRVADQVMRMTAPPAIQRQCASCEEQEKLQRKCAEEEEKKTGLQRKETGAGPQFAPPLVHAVLNSPGCPLDPATRAFMEPRFGQDFSGVRVHTDARAAESARAVNALAYTVGNNIIFGSGQMQPESAEGRRLLAHELTHTLQQRPTSLTGNLRLARQDAGGTDAGAPDALPTGSSGAPPASGDAPTAPTPAAPSTPARAIHLLRVEVLPAHQGHFPRIPGTGTGSHWVGVASATAPKPIVRAVIDPAVSPTDPAVAGLTWSGPGVTPDSSNPLQAEVDRMAGKRVVTATLGGVSRSTTVWAVFVTIKTTAGPAPTFSRSGTAALPGATVDFDAKVFPNSILTDPDHPALEGGNDTPPPGGNHWTGNPLSGGADHHWDFSRKMRTKVINPSGIAEANFVVPGDVLNLFFANRPSSYPARWEEGNDDRSTGDETNDPYTGTLTSGDTPGMLLSHGAGANGDTFEIRLHFLEFVRLELSKAWWVPSQMFPWRVHMRVRKVAGQWANDGTDAAADNAGF